MNATLGRWDRRTVRSDLWLPALILIAGIFLARVPLSLGFALVGGSALVVASLVRPEWALYALVFAVPFGSVKQVQLSGFNLNASEVCVVLIAAGWLARMVVDRQIVVPRLPLLFPLVLFCVTLVLSWAAASSLPAAIKETLKWLEVLLIYVFVASHLNRATVQRLIWVMLAAGGAAALLGVYQFFGRVGPEGFLWETPVGLFMRAYGTFEQPNPYAGYLGLVAPLAYGIWLVSAPAPTGRWRGLGSATMSACLTVLLVAALLMTWSRGALLGFAAAFVVMSVVRSRRAALLFVTLAFILTALGAAQLLPEALTQRFLDFLPFLSIPDISRVEVNPTNFAIVQRLAHWIAGWRMFVDHPWLGVGAGNYAVAYSRYMVPSWPDALGHAHNYYLNIAAEAGLIGLGAYLLLWVSVVKQIGAALRRSSGLAAGVALGTLGAVVHLTTHNFVDNLWVHNMYLHVAILMGCAVAISVPLPDAFSAHETP